MAKWVKAQSKTLDPFRKGSGVFFYGERTSSIPNGPFPTSHSNASFHLSPLLLKGERWNYKGSGIGDKLGSKLL